MLSSILGKKADQTQMFLEDGVRVPVTIVETDNNVVVLVKENKIQLGFGISKKTNSAPRFFREISLEGQDSPKPGTIISAGDVFKPGDLVKVTGISKGKGFAGVVKRHHFKGGPRTHGQSDRERAPGSIGQTTTPGRVYKGKRMAGRMGGERTTIKNLQILDVDSEKNTLVIKGLVPGGRNSLLIIKKTGEVKKFRPLFKEKEEVIDAD